MYFLKSEKQRESIGVQMIVSCVIKATIVLYRRNTSYRFNCSSCTNSVTSSVIAKVKVTMCHLKNSYLEPSLFLLPLIQSSCF